jgi:hypothetical protein
VGCLRFVLVSGLVLRGISGRKSFGARLAFLSWYAWTDGSRILGCLDSAGGFYRTCIIFQNEGLTYLHLLEAPADTWAADGTTTETSSCSIAISRVLVSADRKLM